MPIITMNRDVRVATTVGHILFFEKGKPLRVPNDPDVIEACLSVGGDMAEDERAKMYQDIAEKNISPTSEARFAQIKEVMEEMKDNPAEHRENFTSAGRPNGRYITKRLGFVVKTEEIEALWALVSKNQ